jgi:hypothetical protein
MCKKLLCSLLATVMLLSAGSVMAFASANEGTAWAKTDPFLIPGKVGRALAVPGEKLVRQYLLPRLAGSVDLGLNLGDMYSDAWINDFLHSLPSLSSMVNGIRPKMVYTAYFTSAPDISDTIKAEVAALPLTATWADVNITWGATDKASFIKGFAQALRPIAAMVLRNPVKEEWTAYYIPAFQALGVPAGMIATQEAIDAAHAALQNAATAAQGDLIVTAVLDPLLTFAESLSADITSLLPILPNLVYNIESVDDLTTKTNALSLGRLALSALGIDASDGFLGFIETKLMDAIAGMGIKNAPALDWEAIAHAGDLDGNGNVVADGTVVYGVLVKYIRQVVETCWPSVNQLLEGAGVPGFLCPAATWMLSSLLWLLLL